MQSLLVEHEVFIRSSIFFGLLAMMATAEYFFPARPVKTAKTQRWLNNLALAILNGILLRLIFPFAAVGVASFAEQEKLGLLNWLPFTAAVAVFLSVLALDLTIYWQHRIFHAVPILWRIHSTHHCDTEVDASTGSRFHTIEIILSFLIKMLAILLLGAPVIAVILFEIILNGMAVFNHSNITLPKRMETWWRLGIVTPSMHSIHHSIKMKESNSNYGFNLSLWDRIFGSYTAQANGDLKLGLKEFPDTKWTLNLKDLILFPFRFRGNSE